MKALILAAGRGSRLKEVTNDKPKGLTQVLGQSLLERQIVSLKSAGIDNICAATGYKAEMIAPLVNQHYVNERWAQTNMVASLLCCEPYLQQSDTVVSYSDIIYSSDAVSKLASTSGDIVLAYDPNWLQQWQARFDNPLDDAETFRIASNGNLIEIGNRAKTVEEIQGQYMGLIKLSPKGFAMIKELVSMLDQASQDKLDMTALFCNLLGADTTINTVAIDDFWFEVDDQHDLAVCERILASA